MILAKIENGELVTTYADDQDRELINLMVADGFKVYIEDDIQVETLGEFQTLKQTHIEEPHQITSIYKVVNNDPILINAEITRLNTELSSTDYKITKAYEYSLIGKPLPYDINSLHTSRQQLRDRINELQELL